MVKKVTKINFNPVIKITKLSEMALFQEIQTEASKGKNGAQGSL